MSVGSWDNRGILWDSSFFIRSFVECVALDNDSLSLSFVLCADCFIESFNRCVTLPTDRRASHANCSPVSLALDFAVDIEWRMLFVAFVAVTLRVVDALEAASVAAFFALSVVVHASEVNSCLIFGIDDDELSIDLGVFVVCSDSVFFEEENLFFSI